MPDRRSGRVWALIDQFAEADNAPPGLRHVCLAVTQLLHAAGTTVSVSSAQATLEPLFSTDPRSEELEELQLTLGQGPSVDASATNLPVLVANLASRRTEHRWPMFVPAALSHGIHGIFAFPVTVGAARVGVVDIYRESAGLLTSTELAYGLVCTDAVLQLALEAQAGVVHDRSYPGYVELADRRAEVHQAAGMVSVQMGVDVTDALARLRAHSYAHDRRLTDVARDVVARLLRFEPDGRDEPQPTTDDDTDPERWL